MPVVDLTRRGLAALPAVSRRTLYFDSKLKGFGLRVSPPSEREPNGSRVWFIKYRPRGAAEPKRFVIASTAVMQPEEARQRAKDLLADVRKGVDPMKELADFRQVDSLETLISTYLAEHVAPLRKASTLSLYRSYLKGHIAPRTNKSDPASKIRPGALGGKKAAEVSSHDILKFRKTIGGANGELQPRTANACVTLIAAAFGWGIKHVKALKGCENPARGIEKYPEDGRERFLTPDEFARLGDALSLAEKDGIPWDTDPKKNAKHAPKNRRVVIDPFAIAAIRLLIFSGARLREILHLRHDEVDMERGLVFLPRERSKSGKKTIVLTAPALKILADLPRVGIYVVASESAGTDEERPRADLHRPWARIIGHAGLGQHGKKGEQNYRAPLRIHDLRHSFASVGVAGNLGLPMIGKLLGHADVKTTAKYSHLAVDPVRRAGDTIANTIQAAMTAKTGAVVIPFRERSE